MEKNTNNASNIIKAYIKFILEQDERPKSMYIFARKSKLKESEIYEHFGSFEAIENSIFKAFFDNTKDLLDKNKEYQTFDARNKLLSFYFTFFEVLKANRSYVLLALQENKNKLKVLSTLSSLKKAFQQYIDELEIETIELKEEKMEKIKNRGLAEFSWGQLLFTLKFWMEDGSPGFEKTDILIEKSITTGFLMLESATLKSAIDLGKFLFKEKINLN
jgi:hypothetical protein